MTDRLWRVAGLALVIALAGNTALWAIVRGENDTFAELVAVVSGITAAALVAVYWVRSLNRFTGETFLVAMAVWIANAIEYGTSDFSTESRVRQCAFYVAFALISLGMYLVSAIAERRE